MIASHQSSIEDGRATDSCFALIRAHQCGVLMVDIVFFFLEGDRVKLAMAYLRPMQQREIR